MRQLSTSVGSQQNGNFPSDIEVNPKEQCKAIYLRSGKEIEGGVTEEKKIHPRVDNKGEPVVREIEKEENVVKNSINEKPTTKKDSLPTYQPPFPYRQRFLKKKLDSDLPSF